MTWRRKSSLEMVRLFCAMKNLRLGDLRTKVSEQGLRGAQDGFGGIQLTPGNGVAGTREGQERTFARIALCSVIVVRREAVPRCVSDSSTSYVPP